MRQRRGIIVVLTGFTLIAIFSFVALSVDTGRIVLEETRMQNAVDAAALAAAQEITAAVYAAGQGQGSASIDANSIAVAEARLMAEQVAAANGVYIDSAADVRFGKRGYDEASGTWPIYWGESPYNVVQVIARRTNTDSEASDSQLQLAFGWAIGRDQVPLQTSATAFVEARDLVVVLDFSASMNDDSSLRSGLGQSVAEQSLDEMWDALKASQVTWPGMTKKKFKNRFGLIDSYEGIYVNSSSSDYVYNYLDLGATKNNGTLKHPFPQAGRYSDGTPREMPDAETSESLWKGYISYVMNKSGDYNRNYGRRTLMDYLQEKRFARNQSEDLWRSPHYPFHAVKDGASLFFRTGTHLL